MSTRTTPLTNTPQLPAGSRGLGPVRLVAEREIRWRLRSKVWRIVTASSLALIVILALAVKLFGDGGPDATVGFTGPSSLQQEIVASGRATGQEFTATPVDAGAGEQQVRDGDLDALVTVTQDGQVHATVKQKLDTTLETALTAMARQLSVHEQVVELGGNPAAFDSALAGAHVEVNTLEPPRSFAPQQLVLGMIAGILIYMALMINGQSVAMGVVEEKSSRVVELLLAAVRPWQLMAGKVLGIGFVGLLQVLVIAGGGAIAAVATGVLTLSVQATVGAIVWLVVWFILGFFAYALLFAALGALVSRQEDIGTVISPVLMLLIIPYVIGVSILPEDPANGVVRILSWLPMFSPSLMPMRVAMGGVPLWESLLAIVLIVATIPALIWLSAKVYSNAVLRSGARVKLRDALRPL